jgi:hypothetical protein
MGHFPSNKPRLKLGPQLRKLPFEEPPEGRALLLLHSLNIRTVKLKLSCRPDENLLLSLCIQLHCCHQLPNCLTIFVSPLRARPPPDGLN